MEKLFELTFQDQTLNPQVGTFTDASQTTGTFTLEDGEYYLTNGDTKGFYAYAPIAIQPDSETDNKVTVEFDLKVVTASVNTHAIIGTYAGVDGSGIPTGAKITLQYTAGDIELVLGSGTTETLIAAADVVVDQWYHFRIDCALDAPTESTYQVKIDGVLVTTVTGATTDYELGIIGVLGTDLHACDECGIKNIRLITDDDYFVGRTALNQAFKDVKGYVDTTKIPLAGSNAISGSLIPSATNTYNLGSPSYQWNNAYIKALTINGVACGDILTHNASEFVDVSTAQTIGGVKTFSDGLFASKSGQGDLATLEDSSINSTNEDENGFPLTGHTNSLKIRGHDTNMIPCMLTGQVYTNGDTAAELRTYKYKDITSNYSAARMVIRYKFADNTGLVTFANIGYIVPDKTNTSSLGSAALQWNNTYTRNILIDNDINIASSMINKTSTSGNLAIRSGPYYSDGASINLKGKDQTDASGGRAYIIANDGTNCTELVIYPTGETKLTTNGTTKNLALQEDVNTLLNGKANSTHSHALESLGANSIPFHNSYPRCKYLGTSITDAQNTAIKNRTYDDLFIGDYWTINGVNWRIVAIDYYYNVGDTNFDKGNIIVMPDTVLYNAPMNETDTTAGAYVGSLMKTQNLNSARTVAQNAFGSHLANHRIMLTNSVDTSGPHNWSWYDSDGVELPNEVQIYGTRVWGSALNGYDVATQKQQFPLMALAPQFVNTRQTYWLQDVPSIFVSSYFAAVASAGNVHLANASTSYGVRPSVTLSYI